MDFKKAYTLWKWKGIHLWTVGHLLLFSGNLELYIPKPNPTDSRVKFLGEFPEIKMRLRQGDGLSSLCSTVLEKIIKEWKKGLDKPVYKWSENWS